MDEGDDLEGEGVLGDALGRVSGVLFHELADGGQGQKGEEAQQLFDVVVGAADKVAVEVEDGGLEAVEPDGVAGALAELGAGAVGEQGHGEADGVVQQALGQLAGGSGSEARMILKASTPVTMLPYWSEPPICIWMPWRVYRCHQSQACMSG